MNENTRLSLYKKSLQSAWGYNDYNDWPIKVNSIMHLFLKEFAAEFLSDMEIARSRNISITDIANSFINPARFYRLIDPVIFGMKRMKIDIDAQRKIVLELLDIVKYMKYGSEFNENGINQILSPEQAQNAISIIPFKKADNKEASLIQRFCGIMWAYTESIFFRAHEVTKEVHGPYIINNSQEKYLVREYLHLNPVDIWWDLPFVPYKNIKIHTKYLKNIDILIDSYNHLFLQSGNYVNDLSEYAIEVDRNYISIDDLMGILPNMQKTMKSIHDWTNRTDWRSKANRYADIYWYRKAPLRSMLGNKWMVPDSVRDNIKNGEINTKRVNKLSNEEIERLIRIVI